MKTMMRVAKGLRGGLQDVADDLGVSAPSLPLPKSPAQLTRVLHLVKHTHTHTNLHALLGDANRTFPPGRLRFTPHGVHVLQNVRALLPRPAGLLGIQRQAVRARRHLLADERLAGSRARRRDACRARGSPRRWRALGCVGRCARRPGFRTDATGSRVRAHGDQWCIHSGGFGGRRWRQVALSIFCQSMRLHPFPTYSLSSLGLICSRSRKNPPPPLCDSLYLFAVYQSKLPSILQWLEPLSVPFCSICSSHPMASNVGLLALMSSFGGA